MSLVLHQLRYDQKVFWRNPAAVFFTVLFPVLLLLIFAVVLLRLLPRGISGFWRDRQ